MDEMTEALWEKARADFAADAPNRAFIEQCRQASQLAGAAQRYRQAKGDVDDVTRELIDERLAAIALLAVGDLEGQRASRTHDRRARPRVIVTFMFAALILAVSLYGLWFAVARLP